MSEERLCSDCGSSTNKLTYIQNGIARCQKCDTDYSRRRFWAEENERRKNEPDRYSMMGGVCFLCDTHAHFGVFRQIARDGNSETCKTWVCWPCHVANPTLKNWEPVAPLRGVDFPADEGVWVDTTDGPVHVIPGGEQE